MRFIITGALLIGPALQGCNLQEEEPTGNEMAPDPPAPNVQEEAPEPGLEAPRPGVAPPAPHLDNPGVEAPDPVIEAPELGTTAPDLAQEVEVPVVGESSRPAASITMGTNAVAPRN